MRAKNEYKFLAEAYNTKLILERVVDGKLMCPEACCGAPVVECTCGPDCPHCNCFMIHKAMKEKGFTNKLLKEGVEEWDFDDFPPQLNLAIKEFENNLANMEDASLHDHLKDIVDEIVAANVDTWGKIIDDDVKEQAIGYLKQRARHAGLDESEITGEEGIFSDVNIEDNEGHPAGGIRSFREKPPIMDALAKAALSKDYKHKPYVSSYVGGESDGFRKIFAVLGSDGKVVHKTRDKQEAHQWLKDNYENI